MLSYFSFIHSGIESAGNPLSDGKKLAERCIRKLEAIPDADQFPPKLLVLLASPAYLDSLKAEQLLSGVIEKFRDSGHGDIPLIGCSVAAVFFDRRIYREGALLVCLASRLFDAKVSVASEVSRNPEDAVETLLSDLAFTEDGKRIHSFVNRSILALFPGFRGNKYLAPQLHELLREKLGTPISIFGGVASANDPNRHRSGILFANRRVYRDALVAAKLEHGTPFGISLAQGLDDTNQTVAVKKVDAADGRIIREFHGGTPEAVMTSLKALTSVPLFADLALDHDPIVDLPVLNGEAVRLTREVEPDHSFHVFEANPEKIRDDLQNATRYSMNRAFLMNPIGALGFRCTGLLRNEKEVKLDLEHDTTLIEQELLLKGAQADEKPYVGGFVDGEAGLDINGKSVISNWSSSTLIVGDELRFRTPVYRGFEKVTEFAGVNVAENQKDGFNRLTKLIYDIGYPGAMLSFCLFDQDRCAIVGQSASGPRYNRLLKQKQVYWTNSDDILAVVARERRPQAVIDSRNLSCSSMRAASRQNIVSQYLVPLTGDDGQVIAILQIDLGDLGYDTKLYDTETTVLDSLGNIVGAALNRSLIWEEGKLINSLDRAMSACQSADTVEQGLQQYLDYVLDAFGLNKGNAGGHIRIAEDQFKLRLIAGTGSYFEVVRKSRQRIDFDDRSPTSRAFRDQKIIIINDAQHNKTHQLMCLRHKNQKVIHAELIKVGSYANVPFVSEREERGTISLVADVPWYFGAFHRPVLEALGHRVGFLLETLRRKERESFLRNVSPPFSKIRNLNDASEVLGEEIEQFAKAIKAEVASLYLWDEDRKRYILKAQHGWKKRQWLDAAYYEENEFWTATRALAGKPDYINNLFQFYKKRHSSSRHAQYAFGQPLSRKFTVEAIALHLRIGSTRFGALTCYREIKPGEDSGFVTTDTTLLQRGADNLSSLIAILESVSLQVWRKHEHARRQQVFDALTPDPSDSSLSIESFEERVSRQVLRAYHAVSVVFYAVSTEKNTLKPDPRLSVVRDTRGEQMVKPSSDPEDVELVQEAIRINYSGERTLLTERLIINDEDKKNPRIVALEGLVTRVVVPLFSQGKLIGALDIRWAFEQASKYTIDYQHGEAFLRMLGDMIGAAYDRELIKQQNENLRKEEQETLDRKKTELRESAIQTRNAFEATTAYVLQHHHEIRDVLNRILEPLDLLMEITSEQSEKERKLLKEMSLKFDHSMETLKPLNLLMEITNKHSKKEHELLKQMSLKIDDGTETLNQMIEIGQQVMNPAFEPLSARTILDEALQIKKNDYADADVTVQLFVSSEDPVVWVDPSLMQIALDCLLDNAYKFMKKDEPGKLTIRVDKHETARNALITIEDNGIGMTEERIQLLREEFYSVDGRIALGVMLSRLILGIHGGSLRYESIWGDLTKAFITLPLDVEQNYD